MNQKVVTATLALVIVAGVLGYLFLKDGKREIPLPGSRSVVEGVITALDQEGEKIRIQTSEGTMEKTVSIGYGTQILVKASSQLPSGEKGYSLREVNIDDLSVGGRVTVAYGAETKEGLLIDVASVVSGGEEELESLQKRLDPQLIGLGEIISFNPESRELVYRVPSFVQSASSNNRVTVSDSTKLFFVLDSVRIPIIHARIPTSVNDLVAGRIVSPIFSEQKGESVLSALIIAPAKK